MVSRQPDILLLKRNLFFKQGGAFVEEEIAQNALARLEGQGELSELTDATFLRRFIREQLGHSGEPHSDSATHTEEPRPTDRKVPVNIQELIDLACAQAQITEEELRDQLIQYLDKVILQAMEDMERISLKIENCRAEAGLPNEAELTQILKYDTRISNRIFKNLHELQRLQANRLNGKPVATSAVDVTLTVDSPTFDDSNHALGENHNSPSALDCIEAADITTADEIYLISQSTMIQEEQPSRGSSSRT